MIKFGMHVQSFSQAKSILCICWGERVRELGREGGREIEREGGRKGEREGEREREGGREGGESECVYCTEPIISGKQIL